MGDQQPTGDQFYLSDYNSDGIINIHDIVAIIYLILEFPAGHSQNEDIFVRSGNNNLINLKALKPVQVFKSKPASDLIKRLKLLPLKKDRRH